MAIRSKDFRGPWDVPLKEYNNHFLVRLIVYDSDDNELTNKVLDYGLLDDRKFIGRISFWAYTNGYVVETFAEPKE